jgi:TRAP transporter TAXI family solute receptor
MKFTRLITIAAALALAGTAAQAQQFFRIGTGGTAGTYYPVGGMIANVVSQPGKIVATAQASSGSVGNVNGIAGGAIEAGFSQADVATWAQKGTGIYEGKPNVPGLRLIANLYPESVHVVVKKGSGIKSVADLKGKRVALDEPGSGTLVNARAILAAYGVTEKDIKPEYIKPNQAGDKMKDGSLDAFFFTGGAPAGAISELASAGGGIDILPIDGPPAEALRKSSPSSPPTPLPPTPTAASARCRRWPWARNSSPATRSPPTRSTRSPKRCTAKPPRSSWPTAMPRASSSRRRTPSRARASPSTRVPNASTRKPACSSEPRP